MSRRRTTDLLSFALIVYGIAFQFLIGYRSFKYSYSLTAAFIIIILALSISLFGFKKNVNTNIKKKIFSVTLIFVLAYFVITYAIGFIFGFNKNAYSMEIPTIISNIISPIIVLISIELIRYIFIENNKFSKQSIGFIVFAITIFEICINVRFADFNNIRVMYIITTTIIIPIIVKNIVFSYLTYNVGYKPVLLYRVVLDLYIYIIPIIPAFNDYFTSVIGIVYPILLYVYTSRIIDEYYNGYEYDFSINKVRWTDIPYLIFLFGLVLLVSGKGPYTIMGVGSDSMGPYINKGDVVILKDYNYKNKLKKGDIIAFNDKEAKDGRVVIHRLVEIKKEKGKTYYITKGDANNSTDDTMTTSSNIVGVVKFRIKYLAYPTVYFNNMFTKGVS